MDIGPYMETHIRPHQAAVRAYLRQHAHKDWPLFHDIAASTYDKPLGPLSAIPLVACASVGGMPVQAVPAAAAWEAANIALRILDNAQDGDRTDTLTEMVGWERAVNISTAFTVWVFELLAKADWPPGKARNLFKEFSHSGLRLLAGQDRDLLNRVPGSIEEGWELMAEKNGAAFALACVAGGYAGDAEYEEMRNLRAYGMHLGILLQIFDDWEGIWAPDGKSDLERGKVNFAVQHGLFSKHPGQKTIQKILEKNQLAEKAAEVKTILEEAGTRDFLLWAAMQERDKARMFTQHLPHNAATQALAGYLDSIFMHANSLISPEKA